MGMQLLLLLDLGCHAKQAGDEGNWLCCKKAEGMVNSALFREEPRSSHHEPAAPVQMASC